MYPENLKYTAEHEWIELTAEGTARFGITDYAQEALGDIVFVMQGDDVEGVHRRAVEFGARIHALPHRFEVRGADGRQVAMTSLSLWDPDDYFIEFNQRHA